MIFVLNSICTNYINCSFPAYEMSTVSIQPTFFPFPFPFAGGGSWGWRLWYNINLPGPREREESI